jgi:streptogramin lyase
VLLAALTATAALAAAPGTPICGGEGIPYPQAALAATPGALWVACRDDGALQRVRAGAATTIQLEGFRPWALAAGSGSLWAIDREQSVLLRLDPDSGRVLRRVAVPGLPVYVWAGAGSVWLGLESGTRVARIDPATGRVRLVEAGDGVSGFASDGRSVWIVSHRDNALTRVEVATGRATRVATALTPVDTTAAERIAFARGALWITGRGLDLLRLDPATGAVTRTVEIGPGGIEVLAIGTRIVVSAATPRGARRGDPILGALVAVDAATARPAPRKIAPAFANGLVLVGGSAWSADTVNGHLTRIALAP